jgi:hypothetical protein
VAGAEDVKSERSGRRLNLMGEAPERPHVSPGENSFDTIDLISWADKTRRLVRHSLAPCNLELTTRWRSRSRDPALDRGSARL